jgi:prophage regulatory protein
MEKTMIIHEDKAVLGRSTRLIRMPELKAKVGRSESKIYALISEKKFPPPVSLGGNAVGWLESEIDDYIAKLVSKRDEALAHAEANPSVKRGRGRPRKSPWSSDIT